MYDIGGHPPISMASLPIEEVDHFKILGFTFDRKLTWSNMIEHISTRGRQRMGALYRIKDYLGPRGLAIAFRAFVRPVCEYGNVAFMGAASTHLSKLYIIQQLAERSSESTFQPCVLAVAPVLLAYFVRCLHLAVETLSSCFVQLLLLYMFRTLTT